MTKVIWDPLAENDIELHFQSWYPPPVMIVCHCRGISDRTIRQVVREGAGSLRQVVMASRAGRVCGGCRPLVQKIIAEETATGTAGEARPAAVAS